MSTQKVPINPDVTERLEENSIQNYLAKLQNSIQNVMARDSSGASLQKSRVAETGISKELKKRSENSERVLQEQTERQEKLGNWVIKEENDEWEEEPEEKNPLYVAQTRLARLERWHFLARKNRRMILRQRLLRKAITDQKREIKQLEKDGQIVGHLKRQYRRQPSASEPVKDIGRIIKGRKI